jgi:hypothetical protein
MPSLVWRIRALVRRAKREGGHAALYCVLSQSTREQEFWRGELPEEGLRPPLATKRAAAAQPWGHMRKRPRHAVNQTRRAARTARETPGTRPMTIRRAGQPCANRAAFLLMLLSRWRSARNPRESSVTDDVEAAARPRRQIVGVECSRRPALGVSPHLRRSSRFAHSSAAAFPVDVCSQSASFDIRSRSIPLDTRAGRG